MPCNAPTQAPGYYGSLPVPWCQCHALARATPSSPVGCCQVYQHLGAAPGHQSQLQLPPAKPQWSGLPRPCRCCGCCGALPHYAAPSYSPCPCAAHCKQLPRPGSRGTATRRAGTGGLKASSSMPYATTQAPTGPWRRPMTLWHCGVRWKCSGISHGLGALCPKTPPETWEVQDSICPNSCMTSAPATRHSHVTASCQQCQCQVLPRGALPGHPYMVLHSPMSPSGATHHCHQPKPTGVARHASHAHMVSPSLGARLSLPWPQPPVPAPALPPCLALPHSPGFWVLPQ